MACNFLETCGRFLYRNPESHHRTKIYLVNKYNYTVGSQVLLLQIDNIQILFILGRYDEVETSYSIGH